MQRTPPRHLAPTERTRSPARHHLLAESIIALAAVVLTAAVLLGSVVGGPESSAARLPNPLPVAPTTTRSAGTVPSSVAGAAGQGAAAAMLADAGFDATLAAWRPVGGAGLERPPEGRGATQALRLTPGASPWPGLMHERVAKVAADRRYEVTLWLRASRPGTEVRLNLYELREGQRFAVDTAGAVAGPGGWQRARLTYQAQYNAQQPDAVLAVEVLAPGLVEGTALLVDDLAVRATAAPPR
jgi:Carbohydrate binding domain